MALCMPIRRSAQGCARQIDEVGHVGGYRAIRVECAAAAAPERPRFLVIVGAARTEQGDDEQVTSPVTPCNRRPPLERRPRVGEALVFM